MTIKELNQKLDALEQPTEAEAAEMEAWTRAKHAPGEVYAPSFWERQRRDMVKLTLAEMPRSIRPLAIKASADFLDSDGSSKVIINPAKAKEFMLELYPINEVSEFTKDQHAFLHALETATRRTKYAVERVYIHTHQEDGTVKVDTELKLGLYAIDFTTAWDAAWAAAKKGIKPRQRREKPEVSKVLTLVGDTQISITAKKYQFALTSKPNPHAYIVVMPEGFFSNAKWSKKGTLESVIPNVEGTGEPYDLPLLTQIFTAAFAATREKTQYTISVYLPDFCANMGIDFNKGNANDVLAKVETFDKLVGVVDGGDLLFKVLQVTAWDEKKQLLTLAVPYMLHILNTIAEEMKGDKTYKKQLARGATPDLIPGYYSWLVHADIVNERNKTGAELAYRIIAGLLQRGIDKEAEDGRTVYRAAFRTLVDDVPRLKARLEQSTTANKNNHLRRAFEAAYKILRTKTDIYKYFVDLQIPATPPTVTTLDTNLVITHRGRDAAFTGTIPSAK